MGSELEVIDAQVLSTMVDPPDVVLAEAKRAAQALRDVIAQKAKPVIMNGEQYLEFEDWQTVGRFYGITAREDGDPEFVNLDGVKGFKASAVAVNGSGRIVGRATAYCLNDEEKWRGRPKYEWVYVLKSGGLCLACLGTSGEKKSHVEIAWSTTERSTMPCSRHRWVKLFELGKEQIQNFAYSLQVASQFPILGVPELFCALASHAGS